MQDASPDNHAAAAWVAGTMDPALRPEFEAHLATCAECQAEVAALRARPTQQLPKLAAAIKVEVAPQPAGGSRRWAVLIAAAAIATLIAGFALGWSVWQMAHR
jgi:anti-sigma factor RsiW